MPSIVLGIDPASYKNMGICVAEIDMDKIPKILDRTTKIFNVDLENKDDRFVELIDFLDFLNKEFKINSVIFERTQFGLPFVMSQIYESVGVIKYWAKLNKCSIVEISPKTAKKAISGNGSATKKQVIKSVMDIFGFTKKDLSSDHEADAISLALAYSKTIDKE